MKINSAASQLERLSKVMPAKDVLAFFDRLIEAKRDIAKSEEAIARLETAREVAILEITRKYDLLHEVFEEVFSDRRDAISKHFDIVEKGIQSDNRDLILGGLKGLAEIVSSSPFANVQELARLLESSTKIEI